MSSNTPQPEKRETEDGYTIYEYSDEQKRRLYNERPEINIDAETAEEVDSRLVLRSILRSFKGRL